MEIKKDLLVGEIAIKIGFLIEEELEEAVEVQEGEMEGEQEARSIGQILKDLDYLTEEQLEEVLELQEIRLNESPSYSDLQKKQILFGKLAVRHGYCSEDELNRALRIQGKESREGEMKRLGQVMMDEDIISEEEVKNILRKQSKKMMICTNCDRIINVARYMHREQHLCPSCKKPLEPVSDQKREVEET